MKRVADEIIHSGGITINTTIMRFLRHKHGVSLTELSRCAGVSPQYLSGIELGEYPATDNAAKLARMAFEHLIERRRDRASQLAADFAAFSERLLDTTDMTQSSASADGGAGTLSDPVENISPHGCGTQ